MNIASSLTPRLPSILDRTHRGLLLGVAGLSVLQLMVTIGVTLGVARVFDALISSQGLTWHPAVIFAAAASLLLAAAGARYWERVVAEQLGQRFVHRIRQRLFSHMLTLTPGTISSQRRGATVLRFIGDLSSQKVWVSSGLIGAMVSAVTVVGGVGALVYLNWQAGCLVGGIVLLTLLVQGRLRRSADERVRRLRRRRSQIATDIVERVSSLATIQSSNESEREQRRLRKKSERVVAAAENAARSSGWFSAVGELSSLSIVCGALLIGGLGLRTGVLSEGTLVACLVLARTLGRPIRRLSRAQVQWIRARVARQKLEAFLQLEPVFEPEQPKRMRRGGGALKLTRLVVDAPSGETVLDGVSERAGAGERVQVTGSNGCGKSTLLRVLAGLTRPAAGRVSIDGRDLARVEMRAVRETVSLISSDLPLLRGSLRRNLTYGVPRSWRKDLPGVLALTGLDAVAQRLPRGLETPIGDRGAILSTGERHRVRIAQAILRRPRVLCIDDVSGSLDSAGKEALAQLIETHPGTVVFVWNCADAPPADRCWDLGSLRSVTSEPSEPRRDLRREVRAATLPSNLGPAPSQVH